LLKSSEYFKGTELIKAPSTYLLLTLYHEKRKDTNNNSYFRDYSDYNFNNFKIYLGGCIMEKAMQEIEELFNSEITDYRLAKDSGVTLSMIQNYRNGSRKIENMTLKTAGKLCKYIESKKEDNNKITPF
jgi:DNA-binding protein